MPSDIADGALHAARLFHLRLAVDAPLMDPQMDVTLEDELLSAGEIKALLALFNRLALVPEVGRYRRPLAFG